MVEERIMASENKVNRDLSQVNSSNQDVDDSLASSTRIRKILEKLYLLAEIKPGKTLSVRTMAIINHNTFNSWCRWWYNEDRFKSLETIESIIDEAKTYLDSFNGERFHEQKKILISALYRAKDGITNLSETYKEDSRVNARVNAIIAQIQGIFLQHEKPILIKCPYFTPTLREITRITRPSPMREIGKKTENEDNISID
jgi:hypothetical protein